MKKVISGILLVVVLAASILYAAPVDVKMSFTIPAAKWATYKKCFLLAYPNQSLNDGEAKLTDGQWVKYRIIMFAKNAYKRGQQIEFEQQQRPVPDPNIVQSQ